VVTPNHFRWELGQPPQTIAIRQPDVLYLLYPNLKRAEKYPLGGAQGGPWREVLALLDATFPRNRGDLESHFTFGTTTLSNGIAELVLQPKSSFARKFMTEIRVAIRTNDFTPTSTELRLSDGSTMRNDFSNSIINQPIPDSQFQPLIGPDTRLVEPLKK
jgi:outer membrane lipoprotein-sorting protein